MNFEFIFKSFLFVIIFILFVFNLYFYRKFIDISENKCFFNFFFPFIMSINCLNIFLLPLEIFFRDNLNKIHLNFDYNNIFHLLIIFVFFLIPFLIFYEIENKENNFYSNFDINKNLNNENNLSENLKKSFLYTFTYNLIIFTLINMINYFIYKNNNNNNNFFEYFKSKKNFYFHFGCFILIGYYFLIKICAFGLGKFPINLIKNKKTFELQKEIFIYKRANIRDKINNLNKKRNLLNDEQNEIEKLKKNENFLSSEIEKLEKIIINNNNNFCLNFCSKIFFPFKKILGILFLFLSLFYVYFIIFTSIKKLILSECKLQCGFLIIKNYEKNSIEKFVEEKKILFKIIYIFTFIYFLICCFYSFIKIGFNIFCYNIFKLKKNNSSLISLLFFIYIFTFLVFGIVLEIFYIFNDFSTFGLCENNNNKCEETFISKLINNVNENFPFFFSIVYFLNFYFGIKIFFVLFYNLFFVVENEYDEFKENENLNTKNNNYDDFNDDEKIILTLNE